jgi:CotS family spore coat protein
MKDRINEIVKEFALKLMKKVPRKDYYIVYTDEGTFYLKKVDLKKSQIHFIHNAKEYLVYRGFKNIDRYVMANKVPYVKKDKDYYIMTKLIGGRKYDINNTEELKKASMTLASLHNASRGYVPRKSSKIISNMEKLQKIYLEKCEDYIYIKSLIKMRSAKGLVDNLFLENIDMLYDMALESVKMLQKNGYFELCQREALERYICHNNYNHNNIIIDKNEEFNVINFDRCRFELRCFDIARFMVDVMDRTKWEFDTVLAILKAYDSIRSLDEREYKIMISFLQFPQAIWEIATKYYYEEYDLSRDRYYKALKDKIEKLPYKLGVLNKYKNEFL